MTSSILAPVLLLAASTGAWQVDAPERVRGCAVAAPLATALATYAPSHAGRVQVSETAPGARITVMDENGSTRLSREIVGGAPACAALVDALVLAVERDLTLVRPPLERTDRPSGLAFGGRAGLTWLTAGSGRPTPSAALTGMFGGRAVRLIADVAAAGPGLLDVAVPSGVVGELRTWTVAARVGPAWCPRLGRAALCLSTTAGAEWLHAQADGALYRGRASSAWQGTARVAVDVAYPLLSDAVRLTLGLECVGRAFRPELRVVGARSQQVSALAPGVGAGLVVGL